MFPGFSFPGFVYRHVSKGFPPVEVSLGIASHTDIMEGIKAVLVCQTLQFDTVEQSQDLTNPQDIRTNPGLSR